jgi:hypothetical protein
MAFPKSLKELCSPALFYFAVSVISVVLISLQNLGNSGTYSIGCYSCQVPSTIMVFVIKMLYILFWTWILNLICKDGHSGISWFLVLLPLILFFVIIGTAIVA